MKFFAHVLRCSALLGSAVFVAGCGDSVSTAPLTRFDGALASTTYSSTIAKGLIVKRTVNVADDIVVTATITPQGGYLVIPEADFFLIFPAGAVSADLVVSATAHKGNKVVYTFEPHGTVFNTPIYVVQALKNTDLNTPRSIKRRPDVWAGYLDEGLLDVTADGFGLFSEVFNAHYYGKGNEALAYFTTTHFSGYAMASGRRESAGGE